MSDADHVKRYPVGDEDKAFILRLRASPEIASGAYRASFDAEAWWQAVRPNLWVLKCRSVRVGYLITRPIHEVSIVLVSGARGSGMGTAALSALLQEDMIAFIRPENLISSRAFLSAGFLHDPGRGKCEVYVKHQEYQR